MATDRASLLAAAAHNARGQSLLDQRRPDEALEHFRRAIDVAPDLAPPHFNLGVAHLIAGRIADAIAPLRRAVELDTNHVGAWLNLGGALQSLRRIDDAADALERATALAPAAITFNGLGLLRLAQARVDDAVTCFRRAVDLDPTSAEAHDNLLLALNYAEHVAPHEFFAEHLRGAKKFETPPIAQRRPHDNDRSPDRRLRVGYVSPDFKQHPVGLSIEPAVAGHHRDGFEVFCYSDVTAEDDVTRRIRAAAEVWRPISGVDDATVAETIRADRIDILIDLAGHTARNRLCVFARKPAPVQVTYLGYSATTGLAAVDYLLGDEHLTPTGMHDALATERIARLPRAYLCYVPPGGCPGVNELPAMSAGHVTFASLNRLSKVTPATFDAWAEIVSRVANSRLIIHADAGRHLDAMCNRWHDAHGLSPDQLEVIERLSLVEYLALHHRIDVALDPFPHNGGTTTRDALYMGVPVVTRVGQLPISRMGLSALATIGLTELVADSWARYLEIAVGLAANLPQLAEIRRTLRLRMAASPMMDRDAYVADLEAAYRAMWQTWCAGG